MRFFYAKKEQICKHCKTIINYGDEAVVIRWKNLNIFIPLVFHAACYIAWMTVGFNRRWQEWKAGAIPRRIRKKRGRKFKYASREQAKSINRKKSLLWYHKNLGHATRIEEIQGEITELTLS